MRFIFLITLILASLTLTACAMESKHSADSTQTSNFDFSIGDITEQQLRSRHAGFFHDDNYQSEQKHIKQLKELASKISIVTYFGVWCHDSQREVPRMLALLSSVNNANISHRLIALDYQKSEPQGRAKQTDIVSTPTFVVLKNGQEIGRIIESPEVSLAQDLLEIIKSSQR